MWRLCYGRICAQNEWQNSSSQAKPIPTAAPNASANLRKFRENGTDTGNTQLSERLAQTLNLKKKPILNLKFFSKLNDRYFLFRITGAVAGTICSLPVWRFPVRPVT
jgi:hypothetical protein